MLIHRKEKNNMLNLVLSGGPSGGKTTSISKIESELTEKLGMKVLIVPETATELIANGISPGENISLEDFQELVLKLQLAKEEIIDRAVEMIGSKDIISFWMKVKQK